MTGQRRSFCTSGLVSGQHPLTANDSNRWLQGTSISSTRLTCHGCHATASLLLVSALAAACYSVAPWDGKGMRSVCCTAALPLSLVGTTGTTSPTSTQHGVPPPPPPSKHTPSHTNTRWLSPPPPPTHTWRTHNNQQPCPHLSRGAVLLKGNLGRADNLQGVG